MSFSVMHLFIIIFSIITTYCLLQLLVVLPAWRDYKAQKARASLAKCFRVLNDGPFQTGTIANGHYLHDHFYRVIYRILMNDELKISTTGNVTHTEHEEIKRKEFRKEIEALDQETKVTVNEAVLSMGTLVFLQNLIQFPTLLFKCVRAKELYDKQARDERLMRSGEYIAITSTDENPHEYTCPA
jgi:hypothetical protein